MRTGDDNWGPWMEGVSRSERLARLRSLRALVHAFFGIEHPVVYALYRAESLADDDLTTALTMFNALPSRDQRKIISTYGSMLTTKTVHEVRLRAASRIKSSSIDRRAS